MPLPRTEEAGAAIDRAAPELFWWLARHPEPSPARVLLAHLLDLRMSGQTGGWGGALVPYPGKPWPATVKDWIAVDNMLTAIPSVRERFTYGRVAALGPEWVSQQTRWHVIRGMVDNGQGEQAEEYLRRVNVHAARQ